MIRGQLLKELEQTLAERPQFRVNDFLINIELTAEKKETKITILYRYDERYWFIAILPRSKTESEHSILKSYAIEIGMSPGELNDRESFTVENKSGLLKTLRDWTGFLQEELETIPERRELAIQREQLEELFKTVSDMPDGYFSREEAEVFAVRLTDLEDKMKHSVSESIQSQEELKQRLERIQADFESLKKSLHTMTKKNWAKAAMVRAAEWLKDPLNRKLLKSGADVAKAILTDDNSSSPS
jgi:hypothetical protein